ncbi:GrpB family protein [Candidatus Daviesbacteria bacterium]|nr:GrpB family protein [Candidatus Daviesbacteria bacterium]
MITRKQLKWINHLSDVDKIKIVPFDPTSEEKFQKVKQKIQDSLGKDISVVHRGASSLGISGQDEIDVYIPVPPSQFDLFIEPLKKIFGNPGSQYPLERVHFVTEVDEKHIDIFLINNECEGWINGVKFENYLRSQPEVLEEYRKL